jgi:hypothetical protein
MPSHIQEQTASDVLQVLTKFQHTLIILNDTHILAKHHEQHYRLPANHL